MLNNRKFLSTGALFIMAFCAFAIPAQLSALESDWGRADHIEARLLSAQSAAGQSTDLQAALHVRLDQGWHTYWRTPGDSGLPPEINWEGSENLKSVEISWPFPKRFDEQGFQTFGYQGEVLFPLRVEPENAGESITLALNYSALVCNDICIPQNLQTALTIPAGEAEETQAAQIITASKDTLPFRGENKNLRIDNVTAGPKGIVINAYSQRGFDDADIFVELPEFALGGIPEITITGDSGRQAQIFIAAPDMGSQGFVAAVSGVLVVITLKADGRAIEQQFTL